MTTKWIILKNLDQEITEVGKSKIWSVGWQAGGPRKSHCAIQVQRSFATELTLAQGRPAFCSIQGFRWLNEAHPVSGNMLYSKSTNLNINLI